MKELKTIKDIEALLCQSKDCTGDDECESYTRADLKRLAISYIKEFQRCQEMYNCDNCVCYNKDTNICNRDIGNFISEINETQTKGERDTAIIFQIALLKHIFNLTEEDIE